MNMSFKEKLKENTNDFYDFLTSPKTAKWCIIILLLTFIPMIIIGLLVAQLPGLDEKAGPFYNIFVNYISDLGSLRYTPIPKFLDDACMLAGVLFIPCILYIRKLVVSASKGTEESGEKSMGMFILGNLAVFLMLIGAIGMFLLGFFSEDVGIMVSYNGFPVNLHEFFTYVLFPFLSFAAIPVGILCLAYSSRMLKLFNLEWPRVLLILVGIYLLIVPQMMCAFFVLEFFPSAPFWEWMYMFSTMAWIIPVAILTLRHANQELASI